MFLNFGFQLVLLWARVYLVQQWLAVSECRHSPCESLHRPKCAMILLFPVANCARLSDRNQSPPASAAHWNGTQPKGLKLQSLTRDSTDRKVLFILLLGIPDCWVVCASPLGPFFISNFSRWFCTPCAQPVFGELSSFLNPLFHFIFGEQSRWDASNQSRYMYMCFKLGSHEQFSIRKFDETGESASDHYTFSPESPYPPTMM